MLKTKRLVGLAVCIFMLLGMVNVSAALPMNERITSVGINSSGNGGDGNGGTTSTVEDVDMGSVYRFTTKNGSNSYSRFNMPFYFPTGYAKGESLYISYYYRVNTAETDSSVTGVPTAVSRGKIFYCYVSDGTVKSFPTAEGAHLAEAGEWRRDEFIIQDTKYGRSSAGNASLYFEMGGVANTVASIDFAGMKCIRLGKATDEEGKTVLEQVQETFSNDSSAKIYLGDEELAADESGYYNAVGSVDSIAETISVVPTVSGSTVKIVKVPDDNLCWITVYSEKADLINPVAGTYTEYFVVCEKPEVTIGANQGKGVRIEMSAINKIEGPDPVKTKAVDPIFGTVDRYAAEYTETAKWPKLELVFTGEETEFKATDYVYFSYYLRVNSAETDSRVTNSPSYICRPVVENNIDSNTSKINLDIAPGEWRRIEYIVPIGADGTKDTLCAKLQFGVGTDYGAFVSFDFANPECYYLGGVTYYDGATEADFSASTIEKLKSTFTSSQELSALSIMGKSVDLAVNPEGCSVVGSADKVMNALAYTTAEEGAYVVVSKLAEDKTNIRVYSHLANILDQKICEYTDYVITNDVLLNGYTLKYNDAVVNDYSGFAAGKYTVDFSLASGTIAGTAMLGAYDENGILLDVGMGDISAKMSLEVNTAKAPKYFKVFVLDGMNPYVTVTRIDANGITE